MFVYEPALMLIGDWPTIIWRTLASIFGITLLAAGLHGYLIRRAAVWERAVLIGAAFCLVKPGWETDLAGFVLFAVIAAVQLAAGRREQALAAVPPR